MEIINNLDVYPKLIVALTGFLALILKIKESFSSIKNKQELKLDLEIYEVIKKNHELNSSILKGKIENRLQKNSTEENKDSITSFFIGLVVFVGFGLWTVDIFQNMVRFNGWVIFTAFLSSIGFSLLFRRENQKRSREAFFIIGFYDQFNFRGGLIISLFSAIATYILYQKIEGFSYWIFVSGLIFIIGFQSVLKNIRRIK